MGTEAYRDIVRAQLKIDEGVRESMYFDSRGYATIGVGRLIDQRLGGRLRPDEIALMLENDIDEAEAAAKAIFLGFEGLSDARKAVLVNMAHNLGQKRLAAFQRLRVAIAVRNWDSAAAEMLDSRWAEQTGVRAIRLAKQMREG